MNSLVLVRHGEADHHLSGLTGGWTDSHLTEVGRQQAELTAARLRGMCEGQHCRLFTSDLARAAESAAIIGGALGIEAALRPGLREFNNGRAANLRPEEAARIQLPPSKPLIDYVPFPEAESWREMTRRVYACLDEIAAAAPSDRVLVVTHTLSGACVVHWWLGHGPDDWERVSFDLDPCSVSLLTVNDFGQRTLSRLNDTAHLAPLGGGPTGARLPGVHA